MASDPTPAEIAAASPCFCFTGSRAQSAIIYLLNQIAGGTLSPSQIASNSACYCFTGTSFEKAAIYLLSIISGGGGGGGGAGTTNLALGGSAPPSDGSITTYWVFDTNTGFLWYNSGTIPAPTWNNV